MWNWSRNSVSKKIEITVLGTPVRDAYLDVDELAFPDQRVVFRVGQSNFNIAYQGEPIRFGEKRVAQNDLDGMNLAGCTIRNGGGAYHTATQLARLCAQRQLPVAISAVDLVTTWPELEFGYEQLGIQHLSLPLARSTTNLVLTNGKPDRLILKSPDARVSLSQIEMSYLRSMLSKRIDVLVVNSPKSVEMARIVQQTTHTAGTAQYSVLTPSLSLKDRIELLLTRDQASVCNLSEFAQLAKVFGVDCPTNEEIAPWGAVGQAMTELARICKTGDLIVTLGAHGCIAGDRATGTLVHIGLHSHRWQHVQEHVLAHPERKNGVGDRFFGSFVLSHALTAHGNGNRTVQAAHNASVDMVCYLAPELSPDPSWFALRQFPHRFGARKVTVGRSCEQGNRDLPHRWGTAAHTRRVMVH